MEWIFKPEERTEEEVDLFAACGCNTSYSAYVGPPCSKQTCGMGYCRYL